MPNDTRSQESTEPTSSTSNTSFAPSDRAEAFMRALHDFEQHDKLDQLLQLFTDDCEVEHKPREELYRGVDAARQFWAGYRGQFHGIRSLFTHVFEAGPNVVLEWYSDGKLPTDRDVRYGGVTIIEFSPDARIKRLRIYYDSAVLRTAKDHAVH